MKKTQCLIVPVQSADRIIRLTQRFKLIDKGLEIARHPEGLLIPLDHSPSSEDMIKLQAEEPDIRLAERDFRERKKLAKSFNELLKDHVPPSLWKDLPRSFDLIGDIAILEFPNRLDNWAPTIGEAILKANPAVRLALRKSGTVFGTHRIRDFQRIGGKGGTETVHRESSCIFRLDVSSVYFNPRLSGERMRIAQQVHPGEQIVDMFAGAGTYSIVIAKSQSRSIVHSIDINPEAVKYLSENIMLNRVADRVLPVHGDVKEVVSDRLRNVADRVIMNYPSQPDDFIDTALSALKKSGGTVHYYCFAQRDQKLEEIQRRVRLRVESYGMRIDRLSFAKQIKEVSPGRVQIALDFRAA